MEIVLKRKWFYEKDTVGELELDPGANLFTCFTLEDRVREIDPATGDGKIAGQTAIPAGRYEVVIDFSQRFQRKMPHLLSVPYFSGIRIHPGNTDEDTEGCILVGTTFDSSKSEDFIGQSRIAFDSLYSFLESAVALGEKVWITITEEPVIDERTRTETTTQGE